MILYVNLIPEISRKQPLKPGNPETEYYKTWSRVRPDTYFTTTTLLIILDIWEYLSYPGGIKASILMLPEFIMHTLTS